jgi:phosphate transport system protein
MTRGELERRLREIQDDMLILGSMVEKAIQKSMDSLCSRDLIVSREVVEEDNAINAKRYEIEEKCIHTMATQQPMAADLRTLVATLTITGQLERIGDHAEGIGRISLMLGHDALPRPLGEMQDMAGVALDMLRRSLTAFVERDAVEARRLCDVDDQVDAMYTRACADLIQHMIRTPEDITRSTYLLWTAHNLERIADRVTNICERTIFMVTGRLEEINVSRY